MANKTILRLVVQEAANPDKWIVHWDLLNVESNVVKLGASLCFTDHTHHLRVHDALSALHPAVGDHKDIHIRVMRLLAAPRVANAL
jgi:hypothetical protein